MATKCKKCSESSVSGMESVPMVEMLAATLTAYTASKVDKALTTNADGTPKTGFLTENPLVKNALYIAAGVGLASYMQDEISKGIAIGSVAYGGFGVIEQFMNQWTGSATPSAAGLYGVQFVRPQNIAGVSPLNAAPRTSLSASGVVPSVIDGTEDSEEILEVVTGSQGGIETGL